MIPAWVCRRRRRRRLPRTNVTNSSAKITKLDGLSGNNAMGPSKPYDGPLVVRRRPYGVIWIRKRRDNCTIHCYPDPCWVCTKPVSCDPTNWPPWPIRPARRPRNMPANDAVCPPGGPPKSLMGTGALSAMGPFKPRA